MFDKHWEGTEGIGAVAVVKGNHERSTVWWRAYRTVIQSPRNVMLRGQSFCWRHLRRPSKGWRWHKPDHLPFPSFLSSLDITANLSLTAFKGALRDIPAFCISSLVVWECYTIWNRVTCGRIEVTHNKSVWGWKGCKVLSLSLFSFSPVLELNPGPHLPLLLLLYDIFLSVLSLCGWQKSGMTLKMPARCMGMCPVSSPPFECGWSGSGQRWRDFVHVGKVDFK